MTTEQMTDNQAKIDTLLSRIDRAGIHDLRLYLQKSDFYTAPCSTRYHLCEPGGLAQHSINVYLALTALRKTFNVAIPLESVAIVSLLHDVCKINSYKPTNKWRKNSDGAWEQYVGYEFFEDLPYGHGEKSVYILSQYITLTEHEATAIRAHMGGWDKDPQTCSNIMGRNQLAVLLHCADLIATHSE